MSFNYVHFIFIFLILLVFGALTFLLITKVKEKTTLYLGVFGLVVTAALSIVVSCFLIDEYTKVAKINNIKYTRILTSESLNFTGILHNDGNFDIGYCTLNVKLTMRAMRRDELPADLFEQKGGFWDNFFKSRKQAQISSVSQDFTIGENLVAKSARPFSVYVRYPTRFGEPKVNYTLTCH